MKEDASPSAVQPALDALIAHFQAGRYAAMEHEARALLRAHPDNGKGWHLFGLSLVVRGQGAAALEALTRASELLPRDVDVWDHLGSANLQLGRYPEAVAAFCRALSLRPDYAASHNNLGNAYLALGRPKDAETEYGRALRCQPDYPQAQGNLGLALQAQGRLDEALACYDQALAASPDNADFHMNRAGALKELGRTDDAITAYEEALRRDPNNVPARTNLLLLHAFAPRLSPAAFLDQARELGRVCTRLAARDPLPPLVSSPRQGRRLRVGYVSGDFCGNHPVPFFLGPVLAHHDRARVEVFLYPSRDAHDATAKRLAGSAEHWTSLAGLTDREAAERIRADGIDVLVDLSAHCRYNRLGVFARRAAPVQAHFLGYCATTGIEQMDYWIGDSVLFPQNAREQFSETPWALPRVWMSYDGREDLPQGGWKPDPDGTIWLGTCNHLSKIQDRTMDLWARVLHVLPQAKLLLKSGQLDQAANRDRTLSAFAARGVEATRLCLLGSTPDWREHMATYDRLDIALDPVDAVSGATTTGDTLWMGVPVVTLAGNTVAKRMAASLVTGLGRPEWVVTTPEAYVEMVVRLAADVDGRRAVRAGQREKMRQSPLGDPKGLAACLEEGFETMLAAKEG